jgi:hypothetical protein
MKRFDFRLQRTLDVRTLQSEKERSELERLHSERNKLSESRDSLRQQLQAAVDEHSLSSTPRYGSDLQQQAMFTLSLHRLDRRLAEQEATVDRAISAQREKCVTADRNRDLLEKLRDAEHHEWRKSVDSEIEQTAAEVWNAVYGRRTPNSSEEAHKIS